MGTEIETEKTGGNATAIFEKVVAMRLRKRIEDTMTSVIDDLEFDDDSIELLSEIANEVLADPKLKARIKSKVYETLDEDKLIDKISTKIVSQLLKA